VGREEMAALRVRYRQAETDPAVREEWEPGPSALK
jgi:hypothetical protein